MIFTPRQHSVVALLIGGIVLFSALGGLAFAQFMTEEEQLKLEKELANTRDRQEGRPPPAKKPTSIAKKTPKDAENGQTAGAKPNP